MRDGDNVLPEIESLRDGVTYGMRILFPGWKGWTGVHGREGYGRSGVVVVGEVGDEARVVAGGVPGAGDDYNCWIGHFFEGKIRRDNGNGTQENRENSVDM